VPAPPPSDPASAAQSAAAAGAGGGGFLLAARRGGLRLIARVGTARAPARSADRGARPGPLCP
jgi:hypothetical protein